MFKSCLQIAFVFALVLAVSKSLVAEEKKEPVYGGRTVGQWVDYIKTAKSEEIQPASKFFAKHGLKSKAAVAILMEATQIEDAVVWRWAIRSLGEIGPAAADAIPVLATMASEQNREGTLIPYDFVSALIKIGPKSVRPMIDFLENDSGVHLHIMAAGVLGGLGAEAKAAVPALLDTIKDKEGRVRVAAAEALWRIEKHRNALPILEDALRDEDAVVRESAQHVLAHAGPEAAPVLARCLKDERPEVRVSAATGLSTLCSKSKKPEGVAEPLAAALTDTSVGVRRHVALALYDLGARSKAVLPALIKALKDPDAGVRGLIMSSIGRLGPDAKPAVPFLAKLLVHDDIKLRADAAITLSNLGLTARSAVPALIEAAKKTSGARPRRSLHDGPPVPGPVPPVPAAVSLTLADVRLRCITALSYIHPESKAVLQVLISSLEDESAMVRAEAAYALSAYGVEEQPAIRALRGALSDDDVEVRRGAVFSLGTIGPPAAAAVPDLVKVLEAAAVPDLVKVLENDYRAGQLFVDVVITLGEIGPRAADAAPALRRLLDSAYLQLGVEAAVTLIKIGKPAGTIPVLIAVVEMANQHIKQYPAADFFSEGDAAILGLSLCGPAAKAAIPALLASLEHGSKEVRRSAAMALGAIGVDEKGAVVTAMKKAVHDKDHGVRVWAFFALWQLEKIDTAVPALILATGETPGNDNRSLEWPGRFAAEESAITALSHIRPVAKSTILLMIDSIEVRIKYLHKSPSAVMRVLVHVEALGNIGPDAKAALPVLRRVLQTGDPDLRRAAAKAMEKIDPKAARRTTS